MFRCRAGLGLAIAFATAGCSLLVSTSDLTGGGGTDASSEGAAAAPEASADATTKQAPDAVADGGSEDATGFPPGTVVGTDGHHYLLRAGAITWTAANQSAQDARGHLVTLSSAEENTFVYDLVGAGNTAWIGAQQAPGSQEPAGGWGWVTGEPWVFVNWEADQPDNSGGNEDAARFSAENSLGAWGDFSSVDTSDGYVIEFE